MDNQKADKEKFLILELLQVKHEGVSPFSIWNELKGLSAKYHIQKLQKITHNELKTKCNS